MSHPQRPGEGWDRFELELLRSARGDDPPSAARKRAFAVFGAGGGGALAGSTGARAAAGAVPKAAAALGGGAAKGALVAAFKWGALSVLAVGAVGSAVHFTNATSQRVDASRRPISVTPSAQVASNATLGALDVRPPSSPAESLQNPASTARAMNEWPAPPPLSPLPGPSPARARAEVLSPPFTARPAKPGPAVSEAPPAAPLVESTADVPAALPPSPAPPLESTIPSTGLARPAQGIPRGDSTRSSSDVEGPGRTPTLAAPTPEIDLAGETAALDSARAALAARQPDSALRALDGYARAYPRGVLSPEAMALRIEALVARGEGRRARSLGRAFVQAYPTSPLAARVRSALEL